MPIFGQYQGGMGGDFNVGANMKDVLNEQNKTHQSMLDAVAKYNGAKEEMTTLQGQVGSVLSNYKVDENGKPDASAPKYVHDLFNAVNKEGGVANLSRTQMAAGLKAYETGFGVEAQKQKLRSTQLANDITELQLQTALRAQKDAERIREAQNNPELKAKIEAIKKEGTKDVKKVIKQIKVAGETVNYSGEEMTPLLEALKEAQDSGDKTKIADAEDNIGRLLHSKTSVGQEEVDDEFIEEGGGSWTKKKNEKFKPYMSARQAAGVTELKAGEAAPTPTLPADLLKTFSNTELKKYIEAKKGTEENEQAKLALEVAQAEAKTGLKVVGNRRVGDALGVFPKTNAPDTRIEWNNPEAQKIQLQVDAADLKIKNLKDRIAINNGSESPQQFYGGTGSTLGFNPKIPRGDAKANAASIARDNLEIRKLEAEKTTLNKKIDDVEAKTRIGLMKGIQKVNTPYGGGSIEASRATWQDVEGVVQEKYQRTLDEQTNDEFAIMTNYFQATGGVPATFTKEAFYASKGIQRPMVVPAGFGYVAATGPDGKTHFLADKSMESSQLSVTDSEKMWKAGEFSKARNLNGLTVNGYSFNGEVRVGDIDQANKVKDGVFKTTRALSALDSPIDIAENKSMFSKLLPTEVSGIAQALNNTVQAANRTEVGGSGAWSNQDQVNLDKIIRDPSSAHNTIFSSQAVASLKEYRKRLEQSMVDSGQVYGFAFEKSGSNGSMSSQVSQFRIKYAAGMARFNDPAQALEYAKQSLNFDASE